jgi:predicted DNA-binding transcriptional regulator AlpA
MKETYLTADQIAKTLKISKEKVKLLAKHGLFPKPLKLHTGAVLWSEKVVKDWVGMKQQTEDWISKDIDSELF